MRVEISRVALVAVVAVVFCACGGGSQGPASASAGSAPPPEAPAEEAEGFTEDEDAWEGEAEAVEDSSGAQQDDDPEAAVADTPRPKEKRTMPVIQEVVQDHRAGVRSCYEEAREKDSSVKAGDLVIQFVINPDGTVKSAKLNKDRSTLTSPKLVDCAVEVIRGIKFPPSSRGRETEVNYPFNLNP